MDKKYENFFTDLTNTMPFLKVGAEGSAGTGKSYTLALLVAGLHKRIGSEKPVVIYDTERSAKFLRPFFAERGIEVRLKESRTLSDLTATMDWCDSGNADILIIDSITHVWEHFLQTYQEKNQRARLRFDDWGKIKPLWKREYSERLVMGRYNILFTGREGFIYDYEEIDGKKELVKTGVKMKVEGETAYEPDLLIRMERFEDVLTEPKRIWRTATVIKDRANLIDGQVFENPIYDNFAPVVDFLLSDIGNPVQTTTLNDDSLVHQERENHDERTQQQIMLQRCWNEIDKVASGTSRDAKAMRLALTNYAFVGETSELAISRMSAAQLGDAWENRLKPMVKLIDDCQRGEAKVYPDDKTAMKARTEHLETTNLGECTVDQLRGYRKQLVDIVRSREDVKEITNVGN